MGALHVGIPWHDVLTSSIVVERKSSLELTGIITFGRPTTLAHTTVQFLPHDLRGRLDASYLSICQALDGSEALGGGWPSLP